MTDKTSKPTSAYDIDLSPRSTSYPAPFTQLMALRDKRRLGDAFGLENFGVNMTTLLPGGSSALLHAHTLQDEFVYVLDGQAVLQFGDEEYSMTAGDCMGFRAGTGLAHQLCNRSDAPVTYLEIGDRTPGDSVTYPNDDLKATLGNDGNWLFYNKNGTQY